MNLDMGMLRDLARKHGWTFLLVGLIILVLWQGLTAYVRVRSWNTLKAKVTDLVEGRSVRGEDPKEEKDLSGRKIEKTFFYHPTAEYRLTAIFDDCAVINGREVRKDDRIGKAVVIKVEVNAVTLQEEGAEEPLVITMHKGF